MADQYRIRESADGIELALHVRPRSKRNVIAGVHSGALKLKVTAPPVDDAANRSVLEYFAALLEIPKSRVQIIGGSRSREKTILIRGISLERVRSAIQALLA